MYRTLMRNGVRALPCHETIFSPRNTAVLNGRTYSSFSNTPQVNPSFTLPPLESIKSNVDGGVVLKKYQDLIKHLPLTATFKIDSLDDSEKLKQISDAMKDGNFKALDCADPDLLYFGLKAVKLGMISAEEFATASIYWGIRKDHAIDDIQIIPLFNEDGTVNGSVASMILKTLKITSETGRALHGKEEISSPLQLHKFFEYMRKEPKSQQKLFVVRDLEDPNLLKLRINKEPEENKNNIQSLLHLSGHTTIGQAIYIQPGINAFSRFQENGCPFRIIPNWSIAQMFLKAQFGQQALELYPSIDFATAKEMEEDNLKRRRVV